MQTLELRASTNSFVRSYHRLSRRTKSSDPEWLSSHSNDPELGHDRNTMDTAPLFDSFRPTFFSPTTKLQQI